MSFQDFSSQDRPSGQLIVPVEGDKLIVKNLGGKILISVIHTNKCDGVSVQHRNDVNLVEG